ncbi:succinate dehydrogenase, hydrophobic membrane anchor protein [Meridianimarinicoccus roseus]|jgi:succinate dehydrogenase / fumarate reductase membrane anchor subunit|uniref:Succinate dehydrogenase hydrophobic membrane anchor subunit n=1 Tax=Meridianimarinicoccus roseus TaxID=2072018 RepID=A0A2V2LCA8_9RHOB|nr:succinate dehydrogenase, hydrophobic membrane anchor protein [Meridianimarinicoccus roseus]PWR01381.1 succinate dehydrogenase, hydrophobic membrane anchor protein [Meridianimarinicoccus roseus]
MAYLTDLKRARGMGAAKTGTEHFWNMTVSSVALLVLIPLFVFTVGPMIGAPYAEVAAHFARPFPAIVTGLTIVVGFLHFKGGVQVLIEDYVHGMARKVWIIAMICLSYAAIGTGLFALVRLAL